MAANNGEANELAKATLQRMADAFFEADGTAFGNPAIKAGSKVKVKGVGTKFGGTYTVTSSSHTYRGHDRLPDAPSRSPAARAARCWS